VAGCYGWLVLAKKNSIATLGTQSRGVGQPLIRLRKTIIVRDGPALLHADFKIAGSIGSFRRRLPVAAKIALATAGAIVAVPGSPMLPGACVLELRRRRHGRCRHRTILRRRIWFRSCQVRRKNQSTGVSASTSTVWSVPFILIEKAMAVW
jgi:hypothetical protein